MLCCIDLVLNSQGIDLLYGEEMKILRDFRGFWWSHVSVLIWFFL